MQWFYAVQGEQFGPVDETQLAQLRDSGAIGEESLVWRDGMAGWLPYREAVAAVPAARSANPTSGGIRCAECGNAFRPDQVVRLADVFVCAACKPVRLQKISEGVTDSPAATIRKDHIRHEASVRSVGLLYFITAGLLGLGSVAGLTTLEAAGMVGGAVFLLFSAGLIAAGVGIRGLKPWARIVSGVLSGIGLIGFPLGTIINAYILYLLFSRKGATVFSEEYKQVIAVTPHIKYRTSIVVWILLGLVVVLLLIGMIGLIASNAMRR